MNMAAVATVAAQRERINPYLLKALTEFPKPLDFIDRYAAG
jgi:hypothetical protein